MSTKWNPLLVFALLLMLVGEGVTPVRAAGSYQVASSVAGDWF